MTHKDKLESELDRLSISIRYTTDEYEKKRCMEVTQTPTHTFTSVELDGETYHIVVGCSYRVLNRIILEDFDLIHN